MAAGRGSAGKISKGGTDGVKRFLRSKTVIACAAVLAVILVMAIISFAAQGSSSPVSNFFGIVTKPFRAAASSISGAIGRFYSRMYEYDELLEENERLKKTIAAMEEDIRIGEQLIAENERLRELSGLTESRRDLTLCMANVVSRSSSNWESAFTISKGRSGGIEKFDCVINEEGFLVGQVSEVGENWAVVSTLIDTTTELGAVIQRTGDTAAAEGDFELMREGLLRLAYFPEDAVLLNGDTVLTSGVGGVYPSGIVIGKIVDVYASEGNVGSYASVEPSAELDDLVQVFVVTDFDISE